MIDRIYFSCAKSYTFDDFEFNMRSMESIYSDIRSYLSNVGFERWSQANSRRRRYDMMTTNPSQSVNSILKENKNLHVASLIDGIREFLQKWFHDRREASLSMKTILTSWTEGILRKQHEESRSFLVRVLLFFLFFSFRYIISIEERKSAIEVCHCLSMIEL